MSNEGDWVFDPFSGTGTSIIAAIRNGRRGAGAETEGKYIEISRSRIQETVAGTLKVRPMNKPKYDPNIAGNKLIKAPWEQEQGRGIPAVPLVLIGIES